MKKFLLSLACFVGFVGAVNAETVSITFSDNFTANSTDLTGISLNDDISVSFDKGSGSTAPQYYTNGTAVRWYAGNTMTVTSESNSITKIEFTFGSSDGSNAITADVGNFASPTWTGSSSTVVFTEGGTNGNRRIAGLTVTYGEGGGTIDPDPDPVDPPTGGDVAEVTFDFANNAYGLPNDQNTYVTTPTTISEGLVELTLNGNTNAWRYWSDGLREYRNNSPSFTVTASGGKITEITWTNNSGVVISETSKGTSITSWTGSAESVTLYADGSTGNAAIKTLTVKYEGGEAPAVATPTISCTDNVVTIACATEGADVYYTLDGETPTQSSTKYANPFSITENLTVKAIAYKDGEASAVASYNAIYVGNYKGFEALVNEGANAEGTVDGPITVVYQNGQYLYVVDSSNYPMLVYGSVNATLTNGQTLSEISGKYSPYSGLPELTNPKLGTVGTGTPVEPQTITDAVNDALINTYVLFNNVTIDANKNMTYGDNTIVLYSRFTGVDLPTDYTKNYNVTGFVSTYNGTLQVYPTAFEEVTNVSQVATPVISPNGGAVVENTEVTITCETDGASIYYTLDGTEPSEAANLYQAPIVITEAVTIKAIAVKEGMTDSYVATAEFTVIDPNAKNGTFDFTDPTSLSTPITPSENVSEGVNLEYGVPFTSNAVTLTFDKGKATTDSRIWTANQGVQLRIYTNSTFTISVPEKTMIKSVEIAYVSGNFGLTPSVGVLSEANPAIWTPSETATLAADETGVREITFTVTKTSYIQSITVNYDVSTGVEAIEAINDGEAVYYNLQGVKVNNPERGIFVKVQNGKAVKVVK